MSAEILLVFSVVGLKRCFAVRLALDFGQLGGLFSCGFEPLKVGLVMGSS